MRAAGRAALLSMAMFGWGAAGVLAQDPVDGDGVRRPPAVSVHAGWFGAEADSLEAGPTVGISFAFPLASWIVLSPQVDRRTVVWPGDDTRAEWILDFAVQAEYSVGAWAPYAGLSVGAVFDFRDERAFSEEYVIDAYGAMGGVRWSLTDRIGAKAEARWRFLDGWEDGALATTAGISWRF